MMPHSLVFLDWEFLWLFGKVDSKISPLGVSPALDTIIIGYKNVYIDNRKHVAIVVDIEHSSVKGGFCFDCATFVSFDLLALQYLVK